MSGRSSNVRKVKISGLLKQLIFIFFTMMIILPLLSVLFISFKSDMEYVKTFALLPPKKIFFGNYVRVFFEAKILNALKNSFILMGIGTFGSIMLGSMTAYCLSRFDFFLKKYMMAVYIGSVIVPGALLQVMVYKIMKVLSLTGTMGAPILLYIATDIMQIWMYIQYFEGISESLDESAMIDGASYFRIFRSIIFPLLMPATVTVAIIKSIFIYNDMFTQYLYMSSIKLATANIALMMFTGPFATTYNVMAAGVVMVMLPTIILFVFLQRYIFEGVTVGAVKG